MLRHAPSLARKHLPEQHPETGLRRGEAARDVAEETPRSGKRCLRAGAQAHGRRDGTDDEKTGSEARETASQTMQRRWRMRQRRV